LQRVTLNEVIKKKSKLTTGVHQLSVSQRAEEVPH
jgi:hypothetical protein